MRYGLPALASAILGLLLSQAAAAPESLPVLEKVVILQRHGVRAPTKPPADLAPFARDPWAAWPVAPGELTAHGAAALARMGEALRRHYSAVLSGGDCGRVYVWADNSDHRTRQSGAIMADALAPGCKAAHWADGRADDPLFHADEICPADSKAAQAAVTDRLASLLATHRQSYDAARLKLAAILTPGLTREACAGSTDKRCSLLADRNSVKPGGKLSGTLADGATLSENLLLEYAEGMPSPGWGRIGAADLATILPLHDLSADLTRRTPLLAAHNGTLLARQIEALLTDAPARFSVPQDARLVLVAGHDTNLSNIGGMLALDWTLPGQPDVTAPNTALAFERWRDAAGNRFVRIHLFYQTLQQLRDAAPLTTLPRQDLALPGCRQDCPLDRVKARLVSAMAKECLGKP